jgi:hypothetical protein
MSRPLRITLFLVLFAAAQAATAHNLLRASSEPNDWSDPVPVDQPDVSQVYYARLDEGRRQLWFRFTGKAGDRIWFQVGVPVLERLRGLVPRAAVVGPGLTTDDNLGIALPPGTGAVVFESVGEPRYFDEEFTGTESWIWLEREYVLPADGTWYVVAWSPTPVSADDKLWLAIGTKERFGLGDLFSFGAIKRFVRTFHEVR